MELSDKINAVIKMQKFIMANIDREITLDILSQTAFICQRYLYQCPLSQFKQQIICSMYVKTFIYGKYYNTVPPVLCVQF